MSRKTHAVNKRWAEIVSKLPVAVLGKMMDRWMSASWRDCCVCPDAVNFVRIVRIKLKVVISWVSGPESVMKNTGSNSSDGGLGTWTRGREHPPPLCPSSITLYARGRGPVTAWIVAMAWIVADDNSCRCSRHKSSPATIHAVNVSINCRRRQFKPEISLTLRT